MMYWQKWLVDEINKKGWTRGVELGVLKAKLSSYILSKCPRTYLYLVDTWRYYPEREGDEGGETYHKFDMESCYQQALSKLKPYIGRHKIIRIRTTQAPLLVRGEVDFVIVDADHRYEGVKKDIESWWVKIKGGGAMVFDDYHWPSVKRAIHDSFDEEDIQVLQDKGCIVRKGL